MDPILAITLIRGLIRIAKVSNSAYAQYVRDKPALLPDIDIMVVDALTIVKDRAQFDNDFKGVIAVKPLSDLWDAQQRLPISKNGEPDKEATLKLYDAYLKISAERLLRNPGNRKAKFATIEADLAIGGIFAAQWDKDGGPVGPFSRVLLTFADVALEYVGSNPSVLGIGSSEGKLVAALATNLAEILPDATDVNAYGPKAQFGERLATQFLGAGLKTVSDHPDLVFGEKHLQDLVKAFLPPIIAEFPLGDITKEANWVEVSDALIGPAASAALMVVAGQQKAFLGRNFDSNKAVGAVTAALISSVAKTGLNKQFTKDGAIALLHAAASVAAERPELFLPAPDKTKKPDEDEKRRLDAARATAEALIMQVAGLVTKTSKFGPDFVAQVAITALDTLGKNAPAFFNQQDSWERVLSGVSVQILSAFEAAADEQSGKPLDRLFSRAQLIEFTRIVLVEVAKTPNMVAPGDSKEIARIVGALAKAMASDTELLLTPDHWLQIVAVAAEEAAKNPGILFNLKTDTDGGELGEILIRGVLGIASKYAKREPGSVLFGDTLSEVVIFVLRRATGNSKLMLENKAAIETTIENLVRFVMENERYKKYGSKEWLRLAKVLIGGILKTGKVPNLIEEYLDQVLEKGGVA